jgi:acetyltransferase-like isoleucine patch superfamily enzyme
VSPPEPTDPQASGLALFSRSGGRGNRQVVLEELWYWLEGALGWLPGRTGRLVRSLAYRRFLTSDGGLDISELVHIRFPAGLRCGRGVSIGRLAQVTATEGVTLGDDVIIGPQVIVVSNNHVWSDPTRTIRSQGLAGAPIVIERDVWIGGQAVVLAGVTIGEGSVVAAGAVVTRDIPPWSVVTGVPGTVTGHRDATVRADR